MSIALRSMTKDERRAAIRRRLKTSDNELKGLGYWGAHDSTKHKGAKA